MSDFKLMIDVYKRLQDDESRLWWDARLKYSYSHNRFDIYNTIRNIDGVYFHDGDVKIVSEMLRGDEKILIYGTGKMGDYAWFIIEHSVLKDKLVGFVNSNKIPGENVVFNELPVYNPLEISEKFGNECLPLIILASPTNAIEMCSILTRIGYLQSLVYFPCISNCGFTSAMGKQYFDVFEPSSHEVFVDCGCYDGETSIEFSRWCKGRVDYIYAFEPGTENVQSCKRNLDSVRGIPYNLIDAAASDHIGEERFVNSLSSQMDGASHIDVTGDSVIKTETIDHVLNGERATFIKMDIEGSELLALHGAEKTIKKYRPRLAISLYHKYDDIYEIPSYIISLVPDYRLWIRHYSSFECETVLYAE